MTLSGHSLQADGPGRRTPYTSVQASRVRSFLPTVPDFHFMETRRITNLNELEELDVDQ